MTLPPMPPLPVELLIKHLGADSDTPHADAEAMAQAYAEQYGRLCAEAERAELDRLQARVAELEVALSNMLEDGDKTDSEQALAVLTKDFAP